MKGIYFSSYTYCML